MSQVQGIRCQNVKNIINKGLSIEKKKTRAVTFRKFNVLKNTLLNNQTFRFLVFLDDEFSECLVHCSKCCYIYIKKVKKF